MLKEVKKWLDRWNRQWRDAKCFHTLWEMLYFSSVVHRLHLKLSSKHGSAWMARNWKWQVWDWIHTKLQNAITRLLTTCVTQTDRLIHKLENVVRCEFFQQKRGNTQGGRRDRLDGKVPEELLHTSAVGEHKVSVFGGQQSVNVSAGHTGIQAHRRTLWSGGVQKSFYSQTNEKISKCVLTKPELWIISATFIFHLPLVGAGAQASSRCSNAIKQGWAVLSTVSVCTVYRTGCIYWSKC